MEISDKPGKDEAAPSFKVCDPCSKFLHLSKTIFAVQVVIF